MLKIGHTGFSMRRSCYQVLSSNRFKIFATVCLKSMVVFFCTPFVLEVVMVNSSVNHGSSILSLLILELI